MGGRKGREGSDGKERERKGGRRGGRKRREKGREKEEGRDIFSSLLQPIRCHDVQSVSILNV